MALSTSSSSKHPHPPRQSEFDILKASHRFLRDSDADGKPNSLSWNEQLARKYYDSLYREFAVCDLKHYKSGNFALRWRTESEVLSGAGESTCGNTRCEHHHPTRVPDDIPALSTLELPFGYEEQGEQKSALVKMVLCERCVKKLLWKRRKEKEGVEEESTGELKLHRKPDRSAVQVSREREPSGDQSRVGQTSQDSTLKKRRRSSRSLSPRSRLKSDGSVRKAARQHRSVPPNS